jgi:hypothetical protein
MERLKEIEAELSGIAPILGKSRVTGLPYQVPAGYFEHFAESLLQKIRNGAESPETELQVISPLLAGLSRKTPYQVPEGYFNEFRAMGKPEAAESLPPVEPLNDIQTATSATRMAPLRSIRPLLRYAAAAVITAVIAGAAFLTLYHKPSADPLSGLAKVSDQEMANYLENQDIHWVPGTSASTPTATVDFDDAEISELLSNVSDAELEQYLPDLQDQTRKIN